MLATVWFGLVGLLAGIGWAALFAYLAFTAQMPTPELPRRGHYLLALGLVGVGCWLGSLMVAASVPGRIAFFFALPVGAAVCWDVLAYRRQERAEAQQRDKEKLRRAEEGRLRRYDDAERAVLAENPELASKLKQATERRELAYKDDFERLGDAVRRGESVSPQELMDVGIAYTSPGKAERELGQELRALVEKRLARERPSDEEENGEETRLRSGGD